MSAFSNIPPHAVLPLGAYDFAELRKSARRADQRLLHADLGAARDKGAVLDALAKAFELPKHFGRNLDALYDCVTDLEPGPGAEHPGFVVVLENLPSTDAFGAKERNALLDVFREAAEYYYDRDWAFRVFYSVAPA
ncbi:MAG: barstar family protein [Burkholderiaceae bacterium]|nr:barstar family protein [Burkholderiaceae bacterium]